MADFGVHEMRFVPYGVYKTFDVFLSCFIAINRSKINRTIFLFYDLMKFTLESPVYAHYFAGVLSTCLC